MHDHICYNKCKELGLVRFINRSLLLHNGDEEVFDFKGTWTIAPCDLALGPLDVTGLL